MHQKLVVNELITAVELKSRVDVASYLAVDGFGENDMLVLALMYRCDAIPIQVLFYTQ